MTTTTAPISEMQTFTITEEIRVRASLEKCGRNDVETYCATQFEISPRFRIGETKPGAFQSTFENAFFQNAL